MTRSLCWAWLRLTGLSVAALAIASAATIASAANLTLDNFAGKRLWLDSSDAATLTLSGSTVTTWADKSGVGNNMTGAQGPTTGSSLNGLNALDFGNDFLSGTAALAAGDDDYSYFAVWQPDVNTGLQRVYEQRSAGTNATSAILAVNAAYGLNGEGNDRHDLVPFAAGVTRITAMEVNNNVANNLFISDNGSIFTGATGNPGALAVGTQFSAVGNKQSANGEFLDGRLAEAVVFDRNVNVAERMIVENYLSSKWTTTPLATTDRYAGDTAANGDFDSDVFGVGRVDAAASQNTHTGGTVSTGTAAGLKLTATAGLDDGEFVMAGHKVPVNSLTSSNVPAGIAQRWNRTFYVDERDTNDNISLQLAFDFSDSGLAAPSPGNQYSLLYSATNGGVFNPLAALGSVSGDTVTFTLNGSALQTGYYTLGIAAPEPATIAIWSMVGVAALFATGRCIQRRN